MGRSHIQVGLGRWTELLIARQRAFRSRKPPSLFTGDEGVWHLRSGAKGRAADYGKQHRDMLRLLELRTLSETTGPADQGQACGAVVYHGLDLWRSS